MRLVAAGSNWLSRFLTRRRGGALQMFPNNNNNTNYAIFINETSTFYISIGVSLYFSK